MSVSFGSLFAGIGGFDLGFERAGLSVAWQIEKDRACRGVLARHFPNTKIYEDICEIEGGSDLSPVDVICGGFPCQDLSVAGRRKGLAGERSGLWLEFRRIIEERQPRIVVIENVPGLLSSQQGRDFAALLHGLGELGYCAAWRVLDSQYDRVAQRRRRVFVVASLGDGCCAEILFEPESLRWDIAPGAEAREGFAGTPGGGSGSGGGGIVGSVTSKWAKGTGGPAGDECQNLVCGPLVTSHSPNGHGRAGVNNQEAYSGQLVATLTSQYASHWGRSAGNNGGVAENQLISVAPSLSCRPYGDNDGREGLLHVDLGCANGVRRLTPVECERLQGFPDGWTDGQADSPRYCQLGNAVTVSVAEWIGGRILQTLNN